jgi:DNA-binding MarR family transcriptional regulator
MEDKTMYEDETNNFEEQNLIEKILRLEYLLHRHFDKKRRNFGPFGNPHRGQGRVLGLLKIQPVITQKELSFLLDMRPQSLGELLSKLEKNGYITREPSEKDRRIMEIKLTEAGLIAANAIEDSEKHDTIFDSLTEEETNQFDFIITKLLTELEKEMTDSADFPHHNPFDASHVHHHEHNERDHHVRGPEFGGFHGHDDRHMQGDFAGRGPFAGGFHGKEDDFFKGFGRKEPKVSKESKEPKESKTEK